MKNFALIGTMEVLRNYIKEDADYTVTEVNLNDDLSSYDQVFVVCNHITMSEENRIDKSGIKVRKFDTCKGLIKYLMLYSF